MHNLFSLTLISYNVCTMFNMTMYYIGFIWEKAVGASVHRMCITQNPQRDRSPIYALQSTSRKWVRLEKVPIKTLPDDIGALPMINIHWWPNVKHVSLNLAFLGSKQMILAIVVKLLHTNYICTYNKVPFSFIMYNQCYSSIPYGMATSSSFTSSN